MLLGGDTVWTGRPYISVPLCRNEPPPHILLNLLQKLNHAGRVNKHTKEKTVKIFKVTF